MNAEIKQRWVAALRSGEYEQTVQVLRNDDSYCCLGVLCDLHDSTAWMPEPGSLCYQYGEGDDCDTYPNNEVKAWSGIGTVRIFAELAEMNDGGDTFAQIADWIEANL